MEQDDITQGIVGLGMQAAIVVGIIDATRGREGVRHDHGHHHRFPDDRD